MTDRPKRLVLDDLHKVVVTLPPEIKADEGGTTAVLANTIIAISSGRTGSPNIYATTRRRLVSLTMTSHPIGGEKPAPSE
jgi:hypothetical protein